MVPTDKDANQSFKSDGQSPTHYSAFVPLVYSVENSLPLVKLAKWTSGSPIQPLRCFHGRGDGQRPSDAHLLGPDS